MTFEEWKDGYGLVLEPNYSKETEADCLAAFNFGKRESAVLIERQAAQIEVLREALEAAYNGLRWWMDAFPLHVTEADNEEMLKLVKALSTTPDQALEQFAAKVREQCAQMLLSGSFLHDQSPAKLLSIEAAKAIRAIKELP